MDFYDPVTAESAVQWYKELPEHLRKVIDQKIGKFKRGQECPQKEQPEIYAQVRKELGARPLRPADPADPLDGWTFKQIEQYEQLKKWGARYDELLLIKIVLGNASQIQQERKMLNSALGLRENGFPTQGDGLDPTQEATIRWIQQTGPTPLEFLAGVYREEENKMSDRLAAARSLLDFVHRKVPAQLELTGKDGKPLKVDTSQLAKLSDKELATLETLLAKAQKEAK